MKKIEKRSAQEDKEIDETETTTEKIEVQIKADHADPEGNSWNIFHFIKNIVSGFFSSIFNCWTEDEVETKINQSIDTKIQL